ncbi:MAG: hypothetical protein HY774_24075 [Acidobacteria bacterium]|nr:hypothetical protein [Acidobacteriota bacterium]
MTNLSVSDRGRLSLSPRNEVVFDTRQPYIWSCARDGQGTTYVGTGHEGQVYRIDPAGQSKLIADFDELDVTALAVGSKGTLWAATSPNGKVYQIESDGTRTVFFNPEEKYIWALETTDRGELIVATGDKGIVYRVDPSGKSVVVFDSTEVNITSLAVDRLGNIYAGSDPGGVVYRIEGPGKAFAVFDSALREIHRLLIGKNGTVFALAVDDKAVRPASEPVSTGKESVSVTLLSDSASPISSAVNLVNTRSESGAAQSVLYGIQPDGETEIWWGSTELVGLDCLETPQGTILIGTGTHGRLFEVDRQGQTHMVFQTTEDHISNIEAGSSGEVWVTTSNFGKVWKITPGTASDGQYVSPVQDAKCVADWGMISWRGGGEIRVQTRSGNTEIPDDTWSGWSVEVVLGDGEKIKSPTARYLQWQIRFSPASRLDSLKVAYMPKNIAPRISSLTVLSPGIALQETAQPPIDPAILTAGLDPALFGLSGNLPPRKVFQKGARSLQWQGEDANGDQLVYQVSYRLVGQSAWVLLGATQRASFFLVNADVLPDGLYEFKIEVTDAPSNPANRVLVGYQISDPVEVDNSPPAISLKGEPTPRTSGTSVEFQISDQMSLVRRVEYSVNGGSWIPLSPMDGISDQKTETFELELKHSGTAQLVAIRAYDEAANVGTRTVMIKESGKGSAK